MTAWTKIISLKIVAIGHGLRKTIRGPYVAYSKVPFVLDQRWECHADRHEQQGGRTRMSLESAVRAVVWNLGKISMD